MASRRFYSSLSRQCLELDISSVAKKLREGSLSSTELTSSALNVAQTQKLNAYITVTTDEAKVSAQDSDARYAANTSLGPLDGIPIAVKDNFCTLDINTTAGSKVLESFVPTYDAYAIKKLKKNGAVIIGKTNMDEFAMGSASRNTLFGDVINPRSSETDLRTSGGSSGGSAAAVACSSVFGSLGSDTGGSVRLPASYCGVVGFKPSYGAISRHGLIAYGSSLDCPGIFARSVQDTGIIFDTIRGRDDNDATSRDVSKQKVFDLKGVRIGIPSDFHVKELSPRIVSMWNEGAKQLQARGAEIVSVSMPSVRLALPCYYILAPAEASSNLSRYDGLRYGYHAARSGKLLDMYMGNRNEGFDAEVKRRILVGTFVLSSEEYQGYVVKAMQVRRMISNDFNEAFSDVDFLLTPTTAGVAPSMKDETDVDPVKEYLHDVMTVPANLAGVPAISVPSGLEEGLPLGLQLMARPLADQDLLFVARELEEAMK